MASHAFSAGWAAASLFLAGVGQGTISVPALSAAYASIPKARLALANTALNIAQRIGAPVATTLVSMVIALSMHGASSTHPQQFLPAFVALATLHLLCLLAAMRLPARVSLASEG